MKSVNFEVVPISEIAAKGIAAQSDPPKRVILVVDDEAVIADTLSAILAKKGFAVLTAYSGDGALEIARVVPPDMLLADVIMPGMNGIELANAIRATTPDCNILLFSGQAATMDLLANAGAQWRDFEIIAKPIHPGELLKLIANRLESHTSRTLATHITNNHIMPMGTLS